MSGLPIVSGDPVAGRLVIVGCSARKAITSGAIAALELYQGGCVPQLCARLGAHDGFRARVRILSAEHGLITADMPLLSYDRTLDLERAVQLRPMVAWTLIAEGELPGEVLVVAEPLYLVLLADLLATAVRVRWIPDVRHGWDRAAAILDEWRWP